MAARNFKKGERIFVDRPAVYVEMKGNIDKPLVDALKKEMENLSEEEKSLFYKLKETEMHDEDHHLCWVNNIGKEENYLEELKIFLGNQNGGNLYLKCFVLSLIPVLREQSLSVSTNFVRQKICQNSVHICDFLPHDHVKYDY